MPSELEVESTCPNHAYGPLFDGFSDLSRESINTEWNHIPKKSCIRRDSEGLHITTARVVPEVTHALNILTRRLQDPYDTVRIEVEMCIRDSYIGDNAHCDTFCDAVHQRHSEHTKVSRDSFCEVREVNFDYGRYHQKSDKDQSRSRGKTRNRCKDRCEEDGDQEQKSGYYG